MTKRLLPRRRQEEKGCGHRCDLWVGGQASEIECADTDGALFADCFHGLQGSEAETKRGRSGGFASGALPTPAAAAGAAGGGASSSTGARGNG